MQELAVHLLRLQLSDPAWNASFDPYWSSLPAQGTLYRFPPSSIYACCSILRKAIHIALLCLC